MAEFKNAPDTVDAILVRDNKVLVIRRRNEPYKNKLALPGGFVDYGEMVEDAVLREVQEELRVQATIKGILGVYSGNDRDPRGPIISTVFICDFNGEPRAGDDAASLEWIDLDNLNHHEFAFDHNKILADYKKWRETGESYWSSR